MIFIGTIIYIHTQIKLRPFLTSRQNINKTITCQWQWQINNQKELLHGHYARAVFLVSRAALVLSIFNVRPLRRTGLYNIFCNNWSWPKYMAGLTPAYYDKLEKSTKSTRGKSWYNKVMKRDHQHTISRSFKLKKKIHSI